MNCSASLAIMDLCLFQFGFDDDEFKHSDCDASHWELRPSGMIQRRAENLDAVAMGINKNAGKGWQDHIIRKERCWRHHSEDVT